MGKYSNNYGKQNAALVGTAWSHRWFDGAKICKVFGKAKQSEVNLCKSCGFCGWGAGSLPKISWALRLKLVKNLVNNYLAEVILNIIFNKFQGATATTKRKSCPCALSPRALSCGHETDRCNQEILPKQGCHPNPSAGKATGRRRHVGNGAGGGACSPPHRGREARTTHTRARRRGPGGTGAAGVDVRCKK